MSELKPGDGEIYPPEPEEGAGAAARAYWRENLTLMGILLAIWFVVSFGAGILFRDWLDQFSIGGAPLGFWFAQQGAIYVFVVLIFVYSALMGRLERKYNMSDDDAA
jgi:putative solute:sodium symporter small subunit